MRFATKTTGKKHGYQPLRWWFMQEGVLFGEEIIVREDSHPSQFFFGLEEISRELLGDRDGHIGTKLGAWSSMHWGMYLKIPEPSCHGFSTGPL